MSGRSAAGVGGGSPVPSGPSVACDDATDQDPATIERWLAVAAETLVAEGVEAGHLDLLAVEEAEMADLNANHMGSDGPTDVLAFPLDGPDRLDLVAAAPAGEPGDAIHLGDVVLCPAVAARQAPDHAGTVEAEQALLIVHGILHVLGHDHAEPAEAEVMQARERVHLARYGHHHPVDRPDARGVTEAVADAVAATVDRPAAEAGQAPVARPADRGGAEAVVDVGEGP